MAQIYGQIDSLKKMRNVLISKGIDRFNSINDINIFLANYESEKIILILNSIDKYADKNEDSVLSRFSSLLIVKLLDTKVEYLRNNYGNIIRKSTKKIHRKINKDCKLLNEFITDR